MVNDIITNLHPDNDPNTNLYPNIKKENIPSKSISTDKLDDNVLSLIGSLKPSGTDTSTNILAFTSNKGIYVATDNGHWYYWNGNVYADGGVYQSSEDIEQIKEYLVNVINRVGVEVSLGTWTTGQSVNYTNGNIMGGLDETFQRSSKIKLNNNYKYRYTGVLDAYVGICFYDINNTFISGLSKNDNLNEIIIPNNTEYAMFSNFGVNNAKLFVNGVMDTIEKNTNVLFDIVERKNIINSWVNGYVQSNGTFSGYDEGSFKRTGYIDIVGGIKLQTNINLATDVMYIALYNDLKQFVRAISKSEYELSNGVINTNVNEKYVVLSSFRSNKDFSNFYLKYYIDGVDNITKTNKIICWGDSITQGMGMATANTYPQELNSYINNENYKVFNFGQGGNDIATLLSYMGVEILKTNKDLTFEENQTELLFGSASNNGFSLIDGAYSTLKPDNKHSNGLYPKKVYIGNYEFSVSIRNIKWTSSAQGNLNLSYDYYLVRTDTSQLTIPSGTISYYDSVSHNNDYLYIVYMGANGYAINDKEFTVEEYISYLKKIKSLHNNTLFIVPTWTTIYDNEMYKEFGISTINIKEYLSSVKSFNDISLTPSEDDLTAINNGQIAPSYTYDGNPNVHLSANGYKAMAKYIYDRMVCLGLLN